MSQQSASAPTRSASEAHRAPVDWRRLRGPAAVIALVALAVSSVGPSIAALLAGRLAEHPEGGLVAWLAVLLLGSAVLNTVGRYVWATVVDRAAGALRQDLVDAVLHQPLAALSEQAVGEVLDRVDDDTHEVNNLVRMQLWMVLNTVFALVPMWVVAGVSWTPAWVMFPLFAAGAFWLIKPLLGKIAERKVIEEAQWTEHAAAFEEGVAARDDIRTNLGQGFVLANIVRLSSVVHRRFQDVLRLEVGVILRSGLTLHLLLAVAMAVSVVLASRGDLAVSQVVTLVLVTSTFVGRVGRLAEQLPDLQAGLGAITRLRQLMAVEPERVEGDPVPDGDLSLEFRDLTFSYTGDDVVLENVDLRLPAGATLALVGRTGSGKSTLASLVSRAVEPPASQVFVGGRDVLELDVDALRAAVGTVTQKTDILAGTLAENVTLFGEADNARVTAIMAELGLNDWVEGLPNGIDTLLGPGGITLSAGEAQLVAFARLLARDVEVVILDEATARMDPVTEARVVAASERLLKKRTGVIIAHRLSTIERADFVAVLERGRVAQFGTHDELSQAPGHFSRLLEAAEAADASVPEADTPDAPSAPDDQPVLRARRRTDVPAARKVDPAPPLWRGIRDALLVKPLWGAIPGLGFLAFSLVGSVGAITGWVWGTTVEALVADAEWRPWLVASLVAVLLGPGILAWAVSRYPRWWIEVLLRVRLNVLLGQTATSRLEATPPGEVVARAMDADRFVKYADRWVDFLNGLAIVAVTSLVSGTPLTGAVLAAIMLVSSAASALGRPLAGSSAAAASKSRARFGRALVSVVESARTVKLAGRLREAREHLRQVDAGRVDAAVREHRIAAVLQGVPLVAIEAGVVIAWAGVVWDVWSLATGLLVANAAMGFEWFGQVASAVVTEAPGTRAWQQATVAYAGGRDITSLPKDVDLAAGRAPAPQEEPGEPLESLRLEHLSAVHDDGTLGVEDVSLTVEAGELVLVLGQVGAGKSSLLGALAGLVRHTGELRWNGKVVEDEESFLRPGQVAYVSQTPRVLSGTFGDNIRLGLPRRYDEAVADARLVPDIERAGGVDALVGHRGLRLSGGQVQRLALARALATNAELIVADDVSSALDATTELELWNALRERGSTVIGASSKRAALARADRVVVLVDGRVAAVGPWSRLSGRFGALAG